MPNDFDELNVLNSPTSLESLKSSPYYDYFISMDLPDAEIARRIQTAEEFEDEFMVILALALILYQRGKYSSDIIRKRFREAYSRVGNKRVFTDPEYITQRSIEFSRDVERTTSEHLGSEYYTSIDRAMRMSETESNVVNNYAYFREMEKAGYTKKQWRTMLDKRVRDSHKVLEGKTIGLYEYFDVSGYPLLFPCDTSSSPSANAVVGCRCSLRFLK